MHPYVITIAECICGSTKGIVEIGATDPIAPRTTETAV